MILLLAACLSAPETLHLEDALRRARQAQPAFAQARAQAAAAAARTDQALAPLLPGLSGTAQYQRATNNFVPRPSSVPQQIVGTGNSSFATSDFWSFGVTASLNVFDFGQTSGRWRAAQANAEAAEKNVDTALTTLSLDVRTAFFQARAAQALYTVARDTLANQEKHLEQVKAFVDVGQRPPIDLAQARTERANAQLALVNAETQLVVAKGQLSRAMGVEQGTDYEVGDDGMAAVQDEDAALVTLLDAAYGTRPELAGAQALLRAQTLTTRALRGGYGPALGVASGFSDAGRELDGLAWNWSAAVTVSWPFFEGGLTRARVDESEAQTAALTSQVEGLRQQVRFEVEQAAVGVRSAKAGLGAAEEALVNARERLRLAEGRYETGVGSILELGDAQLALTSAEAQRVQADYQLASARARLLWALGRA